MRTLIFDTPANATAFIAALQGSGLAHTELGEMHLRPEAEQQAIEHAAAVHSPENVGEGALNGTFAGATVGVVAGVLGAAAVAATGGLAIPVIMGLAALGSGIGAAVGAAGAAAGVDETRSLGASQLHPGFGADVSRAATEGRVVAVDDAVDEQAMLDLARTYNGAPA